MQARVQVDVVLLVVVLQESRQVELVGHGHVDARADQPEIARIPGFGQVEPVVGGIEDHADVGLEAIPQVGGSIRALALCKIPPKPAENPYVNRLCGLLVN